MRVLMVCPELPRADLPGAMAPTARQIQSLRELGLSIDVVDMQGIPKLKYLQVIPRFHRLARQVDVIHAHFGYCGWLGRLASALLRERPPIVVSFMGDDLLGTPYNAEGDLEWFSKLMVRTNKRLASKVDQVIVKSQEMANVIAPAPSTVIPNGVDFSVFAPFNRQLARRELELPLDRKMVLFPGDPNNPRKGHRLASAAVEFASHQLGEPIDLVPLWGVDPQQVAVYMNACNMMCMTSLIEGSPNVVKEAMACNLPIIGVHVGDVAEMLDGVAGCAVCQRDPREIGAKLADGLSHQFSQEGPSDGRQTLLRRGLDLESVARRVVTIYEKAISHPIPLPRRSSKTDATQRTDLSATSASA